MRDQKAHQGGRRVELQPSELLFWSSLALLPDIDVVGFMRGVWKVETLFRRWM